jgi:predicted O-methyltransferase YrrM
LVWIALAAIPSGLVVAVTAHITTDVAAAPFLWIVPLALYLLTFVVLFRDSPWISHEAAAKLAPFAVAPLALGILDGSPSLWLVTILVNLAALFLLALVCHGEAYRRRPPPARLTEFYLWLSLGGVLGGVFAGLVAPNVFSNTYEYPILIVAALLALPGAFVAGWRRLALAGVAAVAFTVTELWRPGLVRIETARSFFGVHQVVESADGRFRLLFHGTTIHGAERIGAAETRPQPRTYYYFGGPMSEAIEAARRAQGGLGNVAAVGLGTGSLACHKRRDEAWTFFEIDPEVLRIARDPRRFSFLARCAPGTPVVLGDARLTLAAAPQQFDLIVLDAFSSDSIPVHLLTREALAGYLSRLAPRGVIVVHISNRHMELGNVVGAVAGAEGLVAWLKQDESVTDPLAELHANARVAVLARNAADLGDLRHRSGWQRIAPDAVAAWTDDYSDILGALLRKKLGR